MKRFRLLLFLALTAIQLSAQNGTHFPARERGWWTLGLDGGLAYQSSDVRTQFNGWGAGLTLGKNLLYRPGGAFSFDLRGRGLFTRSYGKDLSPSFGIARNPILNGEYNIDLDYTLDQSAPNDSSFVYQNFRHSMGELGLEGVLTFNSLRERTGVVLALFGGIGLDFYRTKTDQLAGGFTYNYLTINAQDSRKNIRSGLENLRDGVYETPADGFSDPALKAGLMPGAGIELGYQVGPRFVIGIGHKITFSRTDILDGQRWTDNNTLTGDNDWQHYTNLHFRWDLIARKDKLAAPRIEVINPGSNPHVTSYANENLRARIQNVHAYSDVQCYLNGSNQPFTFDKNRLSADLRLRPGRNEARIVATNPAGRDEETVIIVLEDRYAPAPPTPAPPVVPPPPAPTARPEVRIVEPSRTPFTTQRDNINLIAQVRNVYERRDLRLLVNGADERFTLAEGLEANIRLREGRNTIRVEANTSAGRASDEIEVIYQRNTPASPPSTPQGQRPVVRITQPRNNSETTTQVNYTLLATVEEVSRKEDITVYLNGNILRNTSYNSRTRQLSADLSLQNGLNSVTVRARNNFGEGEASVSITKNTPQQKPELSIADPRDGASFNQANVSLRANTRYVASRNDVTVELNRRSVPFSFESNSGLITVALTLAEGENAVNITVKNNAGTAQAGVKLLYATPRPPKVTITAPANNSETRTAEAQLTATLVNIENRDNVSVFLNGASVPFTFDAKRKQVNARVTLVEGNNSLRVNARTAAGTDDASVAVRFVKAKAPTVDITNPKEKRAIASKAAFTLKASVQNVFSDKNVQVLFNEAALSSFVLDRAGNLTADVTLKPGKNTFIVRATTADGTAEGSASVQYNVPVTVPVDPKPELAFLVPKRSGGTASEAVLAMKASVKNVSEKSQLRLKLNGQDISGFEFNPRAAALTANLTLKEGNNSIVLEANTKGGTASIQSEIVYRPKTSVPKPEVVIESASQPTVSPFNPDVGRSTVVANVRYIDQKEQITVKLNGVASTDFTFTPSTGKVIWTVSLQRGDNKVEITVSSAAGSATATKMVKFE